TPARPRARRAPGRPGRQRRRPPRAPAAGPRRRRQLDGERPDPRDQRAALEPDARGGGPRPRLGHAHAPRAPRRSRRRPLGGAVVMTFVPDPWEAPAPGHWRRDFRVAEWLPAPMSPSFETWLLPLLEDGYRAACEELFHFRLGERLHVTVNGWYFTNEGEVDGLVRTLARHPRALLAQGVALATFATRPERARDVLALPGRRYHETVVLPALDAAVGRAGDAV